jgi:tetratricopeptide (TPR) repeat protein
MRTHNNYESIEAYRLGQLSGTALTDFEKQLQSDPSLVEQLNLFKEIDEAISNKAVLNFQKLVQAEGEHFRQTNPTSASIISPLSETKVKSISWSRRPLATAATVLVLVMSTFFFLEYLSDTTSPSGKELFAQYFKPQTLDQNFRSIGSSEDADYLTGIAQYQNKEYDKAAATFKALSEKDGEDPVLAFSLANAYLNQQPPRLELAEALFQKIIREGKSIYVHKSKWYLALIFLEKGKTEEAKALLKEVASVQDQYGRDAKSMLKTL